MTFGGVIRYTVSMTLDQAEINQDIVFSGFYESSDVYIQRLTAQGLVPGAVCRLLKRIPLGGVIQLQVRDSVLGLRWKEAKHLMFENEPS